MQGTGKPYPVGVIICILWKYLEKNVEINSRLTRVLVITLQISIGSVSTSYINKHFVIALPIIYNSMNGTVANFENHTIFLNFGLNYYFYIIVVYCFIFVIAHSHVEQGCDN